MEGVARQGEGVVVLQQVEVTSRLPTQHIQNNAVPEGESRYESVSQESQSLQEQVHLLQDKRSTLHLQSLQ